MLFLKKKLVAATVYCTTAVSHCSILRCFALFCTVFSSDSLFHLTSKLLFPFNLFFWMNLIKDIVWTLSIRVNKTLFSLNFWSFIFIPDNGLQSVIISLDRSSYRRVNCNSLTNSCEKASGFIRLKSKLLKTWDLRDFVYMLRLSFPVIQQHHMIWFSKIFFLFQSHQWIQPYWLKMDLISSIYLIFFGLLLGQAHSHSGCFVTAPLCMAGMPEHFTVGVMERKILLQL